MINDFDPKFQVPAQIQLCKVGCFFSVLKTDENYTSFF